jgi:hypothetical protein
MMALPDAVAGAAAGQCTETSDGRQPSSGATMRT